MICPNCGKGCAEDNIFCMYCGAKLDDFEKDDSVQRLSKRIKTSNRDNNNVFHYPSQSHLVDEIYKIYSKDPNINSKLLALEIVKFDMLIEQNQTLMEQNERIIKLLEKFFD